MAKNKYQVAPGGQVPVQANGQTTDGKYYYFRARGTVISLEIAESEQDWTADKMLYSQYLKYGTSYEAGWITYELAIRFCSAMLDNYFLSKSIIPKDIVPHGFSLLSDFCKSKGITRQAIHKNPNKYQWFSISKKKNYIRQID